MLKRTLWLFLGVLLIFGVLAAMIVSFGNSAEPLAPVDPDMLIVMPDGSERTLSALVAQANEPTDTVVEPTELRVAVAEESSSETLRAEIDALGTREVMRRMREERAERMRNPDPNDLYELGVSRLYHGDVDQALALLRSIPESDSRYARAQRRIGWDILTKHKGQPHRGLAYVHECLRSDVTDGNAWQDAARVWGSSLGLPVH